jgi:hypothetical protein
MTKKQFSDEVYKQTGLTLDKDYSIEMGTMTPYSEEDMQSAGMFEGFILTIYAPKVQHHCTKGGDYKKVSDALNLFRLNQ